MRKSEYKATAIIKINSTEAEEYIKLFKFNGTDRLAFVDKKAGKIFIHCKVDEKTGELTPEVEISKKPSYYQVTLPVRKMVRKETLVISKTGIVLEPFFSNELSEKYAFGQTYLWGGEREVFVVEINTNGWVSVDDVSIPLRGIEKIPFLVVKNLISERMSGDIEKILKNFPPKLDFLAPTFPAIIEAFEGFRKENNKLISSVGDAYKNAGKLKLKK